MLTWDEVGLDIMEGYQYSEVVAAANQSRWEKSYRLKSTLELFAE